VWARTYGTYSWNDGHAVLQTADHGFIVAECMQVLDKNAEVCLVRTDAEGNELWTRTIGGTEDDVGYSLQPAADGGYVVVGYTRSYGAGMRDVYLVKTDSQGNVAASVTESSASPACATALLFTCEPNPCHGTTRISFKPQASSSKPLMFRIYDSQGRMVLSREVSTSSFLLSTSDLPSGAYFIRLDAGNQHASTRLILQK
jgi:hypothetical protein